MIYPPRQQLHNAIIYGKVPTLFLDFGIFSVEFSLKHVGSFTTSLVENIALLEKCTTFNDAPGKDIVKSLPLPLFDVLTDIYLEFQQNASARLFECMPQYVEGDESRAQWILAKAVGITSILPTEDSQLNPFQREWIVRNVLQDKVEQTKTITDTIEVLKPWLDKELFTHIEERKATTRENILFDEDEDAMDARIRSAAAEKKPLFDECDTIQIKDNS